MTARALISVALAGALWALCAHGCNKESSDSRAREGAARSLPTRARDAGPSPDTRPARPAPRVVQLSLGYSHACALSSAGTVRCWGDGADGRLGYGNTDTIGDDEPAGAAGDVQVGGPVSELSAGSRHTCALMQTGHVRCWGKNRRGLLGYGHTDNIGDDEHPASAGDIKLGGTAVQVAAGSATTCALLDTGAVRCWGYNQENSLGLGGLAGLDIGDDEHPADAPPMDVGARVSQISLDIGAGCLLLESKDIRCWGHVPGRTRQWDRKPSAVANVPIGGPVQRLIEGGRNTCAWLQSGGLRCFGDIGRAALGYPGREYVDADEDFDKLGDIDVGGALVDVSAGPNHVCVVLQGGAVRCWGQNHIGQLGRGDDEVIGDDETPGSAPVVQVGGPVRAIAAGSAATCALLENGAVRCWGHGKYGQLGYGNTETIGDDETPAAAGDVAIFTGAI